MYSHLTVVLIKLTCCFGYVAYEMFHGFDLKDPYTTYIPSTSPEKTVSNITAITTESPSTQTITIEPLKITHSKCTEEERPMNLGPYEIPTRADVVKLIKHKLAKLFNSYHLKALNLLKDIKDATKATKDIEKKCQASSRLSYTKCVKGVERKYELVTKSLVITLETQRKNISTVIESMACNMTEAKSDPLHFITLLTVEETSLEFALPGFLRLLGSCTNVCKKTVPTSNFKKPSRHMTDQDLVIKHLLTSKNYIELIKGDQIKEKQNNVHKSGHIL